MYMKIMISLHSNLAFKYLQCMKRKLTFMYCDYAKLWPFEEKLVTRVNTHNFMVFTYGNLSNWTIKNKNNDHSE